MYYQKPFYLKWDYWNNSFSYQKRNNPKLYIPQLTEGDLDQLEISPHIHFEVEENWKIKSFKWIKNFIKLKNKQIYIFDNHNHALFFWYKAYFENIIKKNSLLVHIDQHTDMRTPDKFIKEEILEYIRTYTNYHTNVGNFIKPAMQTGLVWEVHQIRTAYSLENFKIPKNENTKILDIDIDFWAEGMENTKTKDKIVKNMIWKFDLITVATSPYFINQEKAIEKIKEIIEN